MYWKKAGMFWWYYSSYLLLNFDLIHKLIIFSGVWSCSLRHSTCYALGNKITVSLTLSLTATTSSHHLNSFLDSMGFTAGRSIASVRECECISEHYGTHALSLPTHMSHPHGIYTIALLSVYMQRAHALPPISYWQDPPIKSSVFGYLQQQSHDMNSRFMKGWIYGTLHARVFRPWRYLYRYTSRRHNNLTTCTTQI